MGSMKKSPLGGWDYLMEIRNIGFFLFYKSVGILKLNFCRE